LCSTQPEFGNICSNSICDEKIFFPLRSNNIDRDEVVP